MSNNSGNPMPLMPAHVSVQLVEYVKGFESFIPNLYNDPAPGGGHCTIGYGHLVHYGPCDGSEPEEFKLGISEPRAVEILAKELESAENDVKTLVRVDLTQGQFDALVSWQFNTGSLKRSALLRFLNDGKYDEAADQFKLWNKAGGKVLPGLVKRRAFEEKLFREGMQEASTFVSADLPTLKRGDKGHYVQLLQAGLRQLGLLIGAQPPTFGPKTELAVRNFQSRQSLQVDGIVGPDTWSALNRMCRG